MTEKLLVATSATAHPSLKMMRRSLGLNQSEFWSRLGVTQSGGSRYESGRNMPKPVKELLRLVHVEKIDLNKINREDFEVSQVLKEDYPDLYKSLTKAVQARIAAKAEAGAS